MSASRGRTLGVLGLLLVAAGLAGIAAGSVGLSPLAVFGELVARVLPLSALPRLSETEATILWTVRLPRVLLAMVVGGALAVVGATLQSVFRNPMADAGLLGVGAGGAFGAVLAVHLGWAHGVFFSLPLSAFAGSLVALGAVYALAHLRGTPTLHGLLLTGIAVGAFMSAGTSVFLVATEEYRVKTVLFWLAGGLEGRSWTHLQAASLFVLPGVALLTLLGRPLDLLSLGEEEAGALGLPVHVARLAILTLTALVAGAATAVAGAVPFVGLVAPHALRPLVGARGRHLLPASFLGGALLVVLADVGARTVSGRYDLPLGALTSFIGAPYFLLALRGQEGS